MRQRRTQGARIAALFAGPRTHYRAAQGALGGRGFILKRVVRRIAGDWELHTSS